MNKNRRTIAFVLGEIFFWLIFCGSFFLAYWLATKD
jgi:hypothetical protein